MSDTNKPSKNSKSELKSEKSEKSETSSRVEIQDNSLISFKLISSFVSELRELFSGKQRSLKLYFRLLSKTTLMHGEAIKKHVDAFRKFLTVNREYIYSKGTEGSLVNGIITYSSKVFIDMQAIFELADRETKTVIFTHLLTISALVDPSGRAREILKEMKETPETDFLSDIFSKIEKSVDPDSDNPMDAVSGFMGSGQFSELLSGMNQGMMDGSLDLGKLMGSLQGVISKLSDQPGASEIPQMSALTNMVGTLADQVNRDPSAPGGGMDMSSMMSMMSMVMGANTPQPPTLTELD